MGPTAKCIDLKRQRGVSSLFLTVILVLVVMLLAVTASVLSSTQFRLAGNLQFENVAKNQGESAIAAAESWLRTGTNAQSGPFATGGTYSTSTPYLYPVGYTTANNIDPLTMAWADTNSVAVGGDDTQRYMIEKTIAGQMLPGTDYSLQYTTQAYCQTVDIFRISARGTSARGANKELQTVYVAPSSLGASCPR